MFLCLRAILPHSPPSWSRDLTSHRYLVRSNWTRCHR